MDRSICKNPYIKNKTVYNWERTRKLQIEYVIPTKKVQIIEYFGNISIQFITDQKKSMKNIKI